MREDQYRITDPLPFYAPFRQSWGTNKYVSQKGRIYTCHTDFLQQLHRSWNLIESFAASFVAMNFIGGVRYVQPTRHPGGSGAGK